MSDVIEVWGVAYGGSVMPMTFYTDRDEAEYAAHKAASDLGLKSVLIRSGMLHLHPLLAAPQFKPRQP